jgi:tetratricopeptide (TPR) repeat protein
MEPGMRFNKVMSGAIDRIAAGVKGKASPDELRETLRFSKRGPNVQLAGRVEACRLLLDRGELEAAREAADEILAFRRAHRTGHNVTINALHTAATAYERCDRLSEAIAVREEMLVLARSRNGADAPQALNLMGRLATDLLKSGETAGAVDLQRQAFDAWRRTTGVESRDTVKAELGLGIALAANGDLPEAQKALEHVVGALGELNPQARIARSWLALTLTRRGNPEASLRLGEETLSITERAYGPDDRRTLRAVDQVAETLWRLGQRERAQSMMEGSLATRERMYGDQDPDTQKARKRLSTLLDEG